MVLWYQLFVVFLGPFPAAYFVARRISGPWTALPTAGLVGAWSVPVYPAPMPSWYVLAFSVYGGLPRRWRDTRSEWGRLFGAGVLAATGGDLRGSGRLPRGRDPCVPRLRPPEETAHISRVPLAGDRRDGPGRRASRVRPRSRLGAREVVNLGLPVVAVAVAMMISAGAAFPRRWVGVPTPACCGARRVLRRPRRARGSPRSSVRRLGRRGDFVEGVLVSPRPDAMSPTGRHLRFRALLSPFCGTLLCAMTRVSRRRRTIGLALVVMAIAGLVLAESSERRI